MERSARRSRWSTSCLVVATAATAAVLFCSPVAVDGQLSLARAPALPSPSSSLPRPSQLCPGARGRLRRALRAPHRGPLRQALRAEADERSEGLGAPLEEEAADKGQEAGVSAGAALDVPEGEFEAAGQESDEEGEEEPTLYFGGVTEEREEGPEETEPMRIASRINEALAMRRAPKPAPLALAETGWYEELGVPPTATQEDLLLNYLEHAEETEAKLAYLLEGGDEDDEEEEGFGDDDEVDEEGVRTSNEEEEEEGEEAGLEEVALQQSASTLAEATEPVEEEEEEVQSEAELVALEFTRISNLYQILSVPQLRKIYDSGGVELLAQKVPALHKGLLEPERVLKMARGQKLPYKEKVSLLLRKEPRVPSFQRYRAANSIKQVLRRMTDVFRVWCFKSGKSLKHREGTIYTQLPEICVFGQVNAGKSSLIQHMFSAGKMRRKRLATAAQWPGKTQGIDVFCVNKRFTVADMPGYGRNITKHETAKAIFADWKYKWKPLVKEYIQTTPWLRAAIYCHDISKDVNAQDIANMQMFRDAGVPVLMVFTKDDKVDSDTHRLSRVKWVRQGMRWPKNWPHAYYTTRRGGYGQVFKNMLGTMMLGLISTEQREDAQMALETEIAEIFHDYRDKYVPKKRTHFGKVKKEKKVRTYPMEEKEYSDEDLEREERQYDREERRRQRAEQKSAGYQRTRRDDVEERGGTVMTPKERRRRWSEMLEAAKAGTLA